MKNRVQTFRRIWRRSPRLAFAWVRRQTVRSAKRLIPNDDWKMDWLGEEMRPFNSQQRREQSPAA
ncbi:MAG: hypothetical protein ACK4Q5_03100 [Saprospiraceae bacterium]